MIVRGKAIPELREALPRTWEWSARGGQIELWHAPGLWVAADRTLIEGMFRWEAENFAEALQQALDRGDLGELQLHRFSCEGYGGRPGFEVYATGVRKDRQYGSPRALHWAPDAGSPGSEPTAACGRPNPARWAGDREWDLLQVRRHPRLCERCEAVESLHRERAEPRSASGPRRCARRSGLGGADGRTDRGALESSFVRADARLARGVRPSVWDASVHPVAGTSSP